VCDSLEEIDLSRIGLGSKGVIEIGYGVKASQSIKTVILRGNPRGWGGFSDINFVKAVTDSNLLRLDLSENHLDFSTMNLYKTHSKGRNLSVIDHGNYLFEEALNTLTHGIGAVLAFFGSIILLYQAYGQSRRVFYSSLIYSFTAVFLYSSSSIYHSSFANKSLSNVLGILGNYLDHFHYMS
jgi:ABC-type multidrug transport system fused ATPase/permease subunit